jgi:hypothetical protein
MSLSFDPVAFNLAEGLKHWGTVMLVVAVVAFFTALVTSLLASGLAGPWQLFVHLGEALRDLAGTSLRRCLALSQLTFREAVRRKTLWVFAVFAVLFLFAGWFLSDVTADADLQVKNYVSFVLRTISWLILPVALLLSCWGLPEDIKARSLHTVVTKPVRRHEIVLGRIFGFAAIGGLVLGIMSAVGYVWINRQLPESMRSQLTARVPVYGDIRFVDNEGHEKDAQGNVLIEGVNTGDENMFRSFVEGNTKARAIWEFSNVEPAQLADGGKLILESSFQAFRTYKGNIEKQLLCQYTLVNPAKNIRVPLKAFEVREFRRNVYDVAAENPSLQDTDGKPVAIADMLAGGKLQVETACLSSAQFLGMARPDLFVRLPDRPFAVGYFKSIANIGLMMLMVVVLGVMSGCFLKGPVATMLTLFIVIVGRMAHGFLDSLVTGKVQYHNRHVQFQGAGPIDALYRILTHMTPGVALEDKPLFRVINWLDNQALTVLWAIRNMFPDFTAFDTTEYSANAFDVPWAEAMLPNLAVAAGYCIPWVIVGYFSLRLRELESK